MYQTEAVGTARCNCSNAVISRVSYKVRAIKLYLLNPLNKDIHTIGIKHSQWNWPIDRTKPAHKYPRNNHIIRWRPLKQCWPFHFTTLLFLWQRSTYYVSFSNQDCSQRFWDKQNICIEFVYFVEFVVSAYQRRRFKNELTFFFTFYAIASPLFW